MDLNMLVRAGEPPWLPSPAAHDLDVWDKYDFPNCGTFRLGDDLAMFTLITIAGTRSLWAYVPVPAAAEERVTGARFDGEAEFDAFVKDCFAGREAVFAASEDFVITAISDRIVIPPGRHALLAAGAVWWARSAADRAMRVERAVAAPERMRTHCSGLRKALWPIFAPDRDRAELGIVRDRAGSRSS